MPKILSRLQFTMVAVLAVMIALTAISAFDLSKQHRDLDGIVSGTTIADVGEMRATIDRFETALVKGRLGGEATSRTRLLDDMRAQLVAMKIGQAAIQQSPEERAARDALDQAMLDLQLAAIDDDGPGLQTRVQATLRDMQNALQALVLAATSSLKLSLADDLSNGRDALRRHLALLGATILCGLSLLLMAIRRAWTQHDLARRDALTGLMNRFGFSEKLAKLVLDPGPGNDAALILIDLDHFKDINDTFGHAVGDSLLKSVGARLAMLADAGTHVGRLGGDEFALVLVARRAHGTAAEKVARIRRLFVEPVDLGTQRVTVSMSMGVAVTPLGWYDAQTLLKNADVALYAAKAAGRGRSRSFSSKMETEFRERRQLEEDLREAVTAGWIEAHFQPVVDLRSEEVVCCEALARWNRPGYGPVSPARFIPVAEDLGLIKQIGTSILQQACAAALHWPHSVRVSVNVSAQQFDADLVGIVAAALDATGLAPARLELEITETVFVKDGPSVARILDDLRRIGVAIALDDFGTGFSSLSYLQRFAIDRIKIDQSFVRSMADRPESTAIVESICLLAAKLGLATTAEGIETDDQALVVRSFGCAEGQGYLFHRPMPLPDSIGRIAGESRAARAA